MAKQASAKPAAHVPDATWAALLGPALAGSRRGPAPAALPGLTPALGAEAGAAEKQLLLTAANLRLVRRAGWRPAPETTTALPPHAPSATERAAEWPVLSSQASAYLLDLLTATPLEHPVPAADWQLLHEQRRRLPHRLLVPALQALATLEDTQTLGRYAPVFGQRGAWLAAHYPSKQVQQQAPFMAAALHPEAPPGMRWGNLLVLRRTNPAQFWRYAADTLLSAAPALQLAVLAFLRHCGKYDIFPPFLTSVLQQLAAGPSATANQDVASWVKAQLSLQPDENRELRYWQVANSYLTLGQHANGQRRLLVSLPKEADPSLDWQTEDLIPYRPLSIQHNRQALLQDLLRNISPSRWAATWGLSLAETLDLAATADTAIFHHPGMVSSSLTAASWGIPDMAAIRLLLAQSAVYKLSPLEVNQLVRWLTPAEQVAWLQTALPALPSSLPPDFRLKQFPGITWAGYFKGAGHEGMPLEVAQVLLAYSRDFLLLPPPAEAQSNWDYYTIVDAICHDTLAAIARSGPPAVLPWLETELPLLLQARPERIGLLGPVLQVAQQRQAFIINMQKPAAPRQ